MNEIFINALVNRIKAGDMTIEQVPIPYKEVAQKRIDELKEKEN